MAGNLLLPFNSIEQGIPVKVVAAHFQKEPQVLLSHPGVFATFEDLKNASQIFVGDAGYQSYYQWMVNAFGFPQELRVPYTFNAAPFIARITSYNVCYTKLLRVSGDPGGAARRHLTGE